MKKHIADLITFCRIPFSLVLLFLPVFSAGFYSLYLLCGFTDMIDGTVARKTGTAGRSGAKLDTAADLVFTAAAMIKLLPVLSLPAWIGLWILGIAVLKIFSFLRCFCLRKTLLSPHTIMNKLTGALLFFLPLTIPFADIRHTVPAVCAVASVAAIQDAFTAKSISSPNSHP